MKKTIDPENISFRQLTPPMILESLLRCTVGLVNMAFLSRIINEAGISIAANAVGVSNQFVMLFQIVATAVATGTIVCLNQAIGMKHQKNINKYASIALLANTVMGLLFGLMFFFLSEWILGQFMPDLSAETHSMSLIYMQIVGTSMVLQCVQIVLSNINRSTGLTRAPLIINLVINCVNILGCYLVVTGRLFTSWQPIAGVAVCNVTAQVVGLIIAGSILLLRTSVRVSFRAITPFPWKDLKLSVSIGIPAGLNNIAYSISQIFTTSIISKTGDVMMNAKLMISSVVSYVALVGMAFAHSAVILIGYRIGAGDFDGANAIRKKVTRIALISNLCCSILLFLLHKPLFGALYSDAAQSILEIASTILLIDIVVELGRALNNTLSGALQATGDVMYQLIVNQASGWILAVGGAYVFGILFGWGLYGVWIAFAMDECTRGLILLFRWRSQKWVAKARLRTQTIAS